MPRLFAPAVRATFLVASALCVQSAHAENLGFLDKLAKCQYPGSPECSEIVLDPEKINTDEIEKIKRKLKNRENFGGQSPLSSRPDLIHGRSLNSVDIPTNKYADEYNAIAEDIFKKAQKLRDRAVQSIPDDKDKGNGEGEGSESSESPVKGDAEPEPEPPEPLSEVEKAMDDAAKAAALFASDMAGKVDTIVSQEIREQAKGVASTMAFATTAEEVVKRMREILADHPEIYTYVPDADKRLDEWAHEKLGYGKEQLDNPFGTTTYVFVSRSLGMQNLKSLMERLGEQEREDLVLVFRGVPEGKRIDDGFQDINDLVKDLEKSPPLILDPGLFRHYDVTVVPTVVRTKGRSALDAISGLDPETNQQKRKYGELVAKVEGLDNDEWLMDKIEKGEKGDLGTMGDVVEISEPDLIEVIRAKFEAFDWAAAKRDAIARVWDNQKFLDLPTALKSRKREVDPTILVTEDIKDMAGNVLRRKGEKVNPMRIRPFTTTMLIFNPTVPDEMKRVGRWLSRNKMAGNAMPMLIATAIDRERGWDAYKELTDRFDKHVFILNEQVRNAFDVQVTPSVVSGDNFKHRFIVQELGPVEEDDAKVKTAK